MNINGLDIKFTDGLLHDDWEYSAYRDQAARTHPDAVSMEIRFEGEDALLYYAMRKQPFERIRRITGYLVGDTGRWNSAKQHELADRVTHGGEK